MKRLSLLLLAIVFAGCAKVHLECPTNGMETATIGGSQVGYTLIAMGASAAKSGGLMAAAPGAATPATSTVDYTWVPVFGQDFASCGNSPSTPMPAPAGK